MPRSRQQRTLAGFDESSPSQTAESPQTSGLAPQESSPESQASAQSTAASIESFARQTVYVVDAYSLIFQVFHAMPEMSSPSGQPTGAIHGFIRDIFDLLERRKPDFLFVAFDVGVKTFRHDLYAEYKGHREEMPPDLRIQIPQIRRTLEALRIPILEQENYEADDILATVARKVEEMGGECVLVTSDKDCRQLITPRVHLLNPRKGIFDAAALLQDWGVRPDQVVDFQTLVGDPVDQVPGVPLIGPKIAGQLLQQYDTLEGVYAHVDEIAGKKRKENLLQFKEQAFLSRQLVRLDAQVPLDIDWNAGRVGRADRQRVLQLFQEFGFRRLGERLDAISTQEAPPPATWLATYNTVKSDDELERLIVEMSQQPRVSFDTETTSLSPRAAQIVGYAFAWKEGEGWYVPVRAPLGDPQLDPDETLAKLAVVLENPAIAKVGQNLKYDMGVLRAAGRTLTGVTFDTMIADYLLEAGEQNHNLDDLARRYLNHVTSKIVDIIGSGKNQRRMDEAPVSLVAPYAGEDADVALRLVPLLQQRLEEEDLTRLLEELEIPLIEVLVELEHNGVKIDVDHLALLSQQYAERMAAIEKEIYALAGKEFNIGSTRQLGQILFDELKLPVIKRTKTGVSTNAEVLEELAPLHALPAKIVEYRQYAKLKSTYVDALPQLVLPQTGRVHTSFNQVVTATGRLSSNEPNLQNIPVRTELGREIRAAFVPGEPSWRLLAADYSQIELRVLAHFSGDEALQTAFANEEDIHTRVASQVFGVSLQDVTSEMRRKAKGVNFGVIYGQSPFGLAKAIQVDQTEAARFIEAYFAQYPGVTAFMEKILEECRQTGYVKTILGRRRRITGIREAARRKDSFQRTLPERTAINTVIQGSAADLIKLAMLGIYRRLRTEQFSARMLLQIHDELIFEAPTEELTPLGGLVVEEMTTVRQLSVPLRVDVKVGDNWAMT